MFVYTPQNIGLLKLKFNSALKRMIIKKIIKKYVQHFTFVYVNLTFLVNPVCDLKKKCYTLKIKIIIS